MLLQCVLINPLYHIDNDKDILSFVISLTKCLPYLEILDQLSKKPKKMENPTSATLWPYLISDKEEEDIKF